MTNSTGISLTNLLPTTSYVLIYTLPLLFVSILLTFAGTFLTLDRTRSFPPHYDAIPGSFQTKKEKRSSFFLLEGGVGGLSAGFAFGVHCSTFLALLLPSISTMSMPSPNSFAAIWILSAVLITPLAGRWKYVALAVMGITGGALLGVAIGIIIHPSILFRAILPAVLAPLLTIAALIPHTQTQHIALRISSACTGAFGIVLAIALLTHILPWADAWDRLWVKERADWGNGAEKGMSAAFCLLSMIGALSDWALKRRFGESPDESWDAYLANYSNALPAFPNRAGTFRPLASFWDRLFRPKHPLSASNISLTGNSPGFNSRSRTLSKDPLLSQLDDVGEDLPGGFAVDPDFSPKLHKPNKAASPAHLRTSSFKPRPEFLRKGRSQGGRLQAMTSSGPGKKRRATVKFQSGSDQGSSDEGESDVTTLVSDYSDKVPRKLDHMKGISSSAQSKTNSSSSLRSPVPEYTDYEERPPPSLLSRTKENKGDKPAVKGRTPSVERFGLEVPLGSVPATPSLIHALDRVAAARGNAFRPTSSSHSPELPANGNLQPSASFGTPRKRETDGLPDQSSGDRAAVKGQKSKDRDGFWKDVLAKAKY